jgi:hypothetical protein
MLNRTTHILLTGLIISFFFTSTIYALQGSGTEGDPYLIASFEDFEEFRLNSNYWAEGFYIRLDSDIDLDPNIPDRIVYQQAPIAYDNDSTSNFDGVTYLGVFNGNGKAIRNLHIDDAGQQNDYLGLFGCIGYGGRIYNLKVENPSIVGNGNLIGSICGRNYAGNIIDCYADGSITCGSSYSYDIGGLCGYNQGQVITCYAKVDVTAMNSNYVGGFCGYNSGLIAGCYAVGLVEGSGNFGGFCGYGYYENIKNCFWDVTASGVLNSSGGEGKTTLEMREIHTFLNNGWDFTDESINGTSDLWIMSSCDGYPELTIFNENYMPHTLNGGGTSSDPYLLYDANDLGVVFHNPTASYKLMRNIDLSSITWSHPPIARFFGSFDGNNYAIYNLTTTTGGLFEWIGREGVICDLEIENLTIEGNGGFCDANYGRITNCNTSGSMEGGGGFCASNMEGAVIEGCHSSVSLEGSAGFCVTNYGSIYNCYATGNVTGEFACAGFCASNRGFITACFSTGNVTSTNTGEPIVGGFCGYAYIGVITNCFSTGNINENGWGYYGGFVGMNHDYSTIINSYSTGSGALNGFCTNNQGIILNCFWDVQASGINRSNGGTGKTTSQMMDINTFLPAGWDFAGEIANGTSSFWVMPNGGGYPELYRCSNQYIPHDLQGNGTPENPYLLYSELDIGAIYDDTTACYILMSNIDLSGITWAGSIVPSFCGEIYGNEYLVNGISVNGGNYLGFCGLLYRNAKITNLFLENVSIYSVPKSWKTGGICSESDSSVIISDCSVTGTVIGYEIAGGLCGLSCSRIKNCSANVIINGYISVGGMCGMNRDQGEVLNCYTMGEVSGTTNVIGGLSGSSTGTIINCYSGSRVSGNSSLGGLLGTNVGMVNSCYSIGEIIGSAFCGGLCGYNSGTVANSFYDINTSGTNSSSGGIGKTTLEMQIQSTFIDEGWDFADTWAICEEVNYPRLQWQIPAADFVCPDGVGAEDLSMLTSCWLETVQVKADINDDDNVDFEDIVRLSQNWLLVGCETCNGADITGDSNVNEMDLNLMTEQWLMIENAGCRMGDLNADGGVDLWDFSIFTRYWLDE